MNSFQNLICDKEGYQMSLQGPDSCEINHEKVENHIGLKWKLKYMSNFPPVKRKHSREFLPRRFKNCLGNMSIYVIPASELGKRYVY